MQLIECQVTLTRPEVALASWKGKPFHNVIATRTTMVLVRNVKALICSGEEVICTMLLGAYYEVLKSICGEKGTPYLDDSILYYRNNTCKCVNLYIITNRIYTDKSHL